MVVVQMTERILKVLIIGGNHHGETAFIPHITLNPLNPIPHWTMLSASVIANSLFAWHLLCLSTRHKANLQNMWALIYECLFLLMASWMLPCHELHQGLGLGYSLTLQRKAMLPIMLYTQKCYCSRCSICSIVCIIVGNSGFW